MTPDQPDVWNLAMAQQIADSVSPQAGYARISGR